MVEPTEADLTDALAQARSAIAQAEAETGILVQRLVELRFLAPARADFETAALWRLARRVHDSGCRQLKADIRDRREVLQYLRGALDVAELSPNQTAH